MGFLIIMSAEFTHLCQPTLALDSDPLTFLTLTP